MPGKGLAPSPLMLVETSPGPEEDLEGEPIVGRLNRLLEKILQEAGIHPTKVYRTYLIKCWPSKTRIGQTYIRSCKAWLRQEIGVVEPKVVVACGKLPAMTLLSNPTSFRLKDVVGQVKNVSYIAAKIAVWYGLNKILQGGIQQYGETISFFRGLNEILRPN